MSFNVHNIQVGSEVAMSVYRSGYTDYIFGLVVKSISPKRTRIVVGRTDRPDTPDVVWTFNADGDRVMVGSWCTDQIHDNVAELRKLVRCRKLRDEAAHQIRNVGSDVKIGYVPNVADMEAALKALEEKIAAARAKLAELSAAEQE